MKAEERKEIETNSLARWINQTFSGGKRDSALFYGLIVLIAVVGVVGWNWWSRSHSRDHAERWVALDVADRDKLKEIEEKYRGTLVGKDAKVRLARLALGPDGLDKLGTTDPDERKKAVASIEEARTLYTAVAPDLKENPILEQEAWVGAAKAEESLIGIPKAEGSAESLGSIDKAIEYLEKARQAAGDTEPGRALQKKIDDYRASKDKLTKFYTDVNKQLATPKLPPLPAFPSAKP